MATTTVSDAVVVPQARGTGLSSEDDAIDAAAAALLAMYSSDRNGGYHEMTVSGRDGGNNTITFNPGIAFVEDDSSSTSGQRGSGGNPQVQSTATSGYDAEVPTNPVYMVIFPSQVTIDVASGQTSQVWVNITDVTSQNAVELRSDGGGGTTAEPSDTYLKLGDFNPDNAGADSIANDETWSHTNLRDVSADDHHTKYTDSDAESAINNDANHGSTASHDYYTDSDAETAINNDADHGSTASHNYFGGAHADLSGVSSDDHHTKYTDSDAQTAINNDADHSSTASHSHNDLSDVSASDHHAKYTDEEARDAAGNMATDGLAHDDANNELGLDVVATGSTSLSSGAATVDTGVGSGTTATFFVAIGPTDDDSEVTASIEAQSGGNYVVHFDEINSSVGTTTFEYDIIRVR